MHQRRTLLEMDQDVMLLGIGHDLDGCVMVRDALCENQFARLCLYALHQI